MSEADVFTLKRGHPLGRRRYLLYFPMQKTVKQAWLGINERAFCRFEPPRKDPPLLYYGTSLINGAFSSRPGLSLAARLAREFDCPLLNFGFAGSAEMQIEVAELIAELAPAAILVDVLQNLDLSLLPGRVEPFLKTVAAAHPDKPILVLENAMALAAFWRDGGGKAQMYWWNVYRRLFRKVRRDFPDLHYVSGLELMGIDRETGSDSVHANDIGFDRMFRALAGALPGSARGSSRPQRRGKKTALPEVFRGFSPAAVRGDFDPAHVFAAAAGMPALRAGRGILHGTIRKGFHENSMPRMSG